AASRSRWACSWCRLPAHWWWNDGLPYGPGSVLVRTTRQPGGRGGGRFDRCPPRSWTVSAVEEQPCGRLPRVTDRLTSRCACAPPVWNGTDSGAEPRIHLVEAAALIRTRVPAGRRRYSSWPMTVPGAIAWSLPSTADVNQRTVAPCARIWSARSAASRAASSARRLAASIAGITAATSDPRNRLRRVHPFGPAGRVADEPDHGCRRFRDPFIVRLFGSARLTVPARRPAVPMTTITAVAAP